VKMKRTIVNGNGYCAVMEDGILVEYIPFDFAGQNGCILTGRIGRLMPGMKCAFVDIGRKKSGFLPLEENGGSFRAEPVRSGEMTILQIKKEETGEKGAYLTRDITLPGRLVMLMPMNRYIGVSGRIQDLKRREEMKETGTKIAAGRYGLVMRNAASDAEEGEIRQEAEKLWALWQKVRERAKESGTAGRILWSNDNAERIRDDYSSGGYEITAATDDMEREIKRQLKEAGERKLQLPGGGNIVIDRCEAMTVIDVNTASAGKGEKERIVTETNLEACAAIARQVRLRNLSGIIVIDFIDMENETDRSLVCGKLTECFKNDRIKTVIHGWTKLGLMEMTRKRTGREME